MKILHLVAIYSQAPSVWDRKLIGSVKQQYSTLVVVFCKVALDMPKEGRNKKEGWVVAILTGAKLKPRSLEHNREPAPVPLWPPQMPLGLTAVQARTAALGSLRLTASAVAPPGLWHRLSCGTAWAVALPGLWHCLSCGAAWTVALPELWHRLSCGTAWTVTPPELWRRLDSLLLSEFLRPCRSWQNAQWIWSSSVIEIRV
jgi:hypothetical protein